MDKISPLYKMGLTKKVQETISDKFSDREITYYIENWQEIYDNFGNANFGISYTDCNREFIDLEETLHGMDGELILKIAVDLGLETPDFIPSIPVFRNEIKSNYRLAARTFEKAFKDIETDPDTACGLAVAALESIIKEIMSDSRISQKCREKSDIYKLAEDILKEYQIFPHPCMLSELRDLGSGLLKCAQALSSIRGDKSMLHGHKEGDIIISEPESTYFIVNCISSIGLFLIALYKRKFPDPIIDDDELPF